MQVLNKRHLNHIESFKKALKVHSEHVLQRQKRVGKRTPKYPVLRCLHDNCDVLNQTERNVNSGGLLLHRKLDKGSFRYHIQPNR